MKTVGTIVAALTLTALAIYTFAPSDTRKSSKLLRADKGFIYDVKVCGTNNYDLELVSWTNDTPVASRSNVMMHLKFKSSNDGSVESMLLKVSKVIPLFSQTYKMNIDYKAGEENDLQSMFSTPLIPIHSTVDLKATIQNSTNSDLLTICGKLDL